MTASRLDLSELERPALEDALEARGYQRFRARQIFRWMYRRGVTDLDAMSDLPRDLRTALADQVTVGTPVLTHRGK
jgi:23S rRNA (adenine2503-C2)-methyltransferase